MCAALPSRAPASLSVYVFPPRRHLIAAEAIDFRTSLSPRRALSLAALAQLHKILRSSHAGLALRCACAVGARRSTPTSALPMKFLFILFFSLFAPHSVCARLAVIAALYGESVKVIATSPISGIIRRAFAILPSSSTFLFNVKDPKQFPIRSRASRISLAGRQLSTRKARRMNLTRAEIRCRSRG